MKTSSTSRVKTNEVGHFRLGKEIGRGGFGTVFEALDTHTGQTAAIKRINLQGVPQNELHSLKMEVSMLQKLLHPNVVRYIDSYATHEYLYIVLEWVEAGSLAGVVKRFGRLSEGLAALYISQALQGLAFLHEQGVVHRDIKGGNLLLDKAGTIKLTDFGVAALAEHARPSGGKDADLAGSPYWMAPEVIELQGAVPASDIWSLGATVTELVTSKPPYFDLSPLSAMFRIVQDETPPILSVNTLSPALRDFLQKCFRKQPELRATAPELLLHPWIRNALAEVASGSASASSSLARGSVLPQEGAVTRSPTPGARRRVDPSQLPPSAPTTSSRLLPAFQGSGSALHLRGYEGKATLNQESAPTVTNDAAHGDAAEGSLEAGDEDEEEEESAWMDLLDAEERAAGVGTGTRQVFARARQRRRPTGTTSSSTTRTTGASSGHERGSGDGGGSAGLRRLAEAAASSTIRLGLVPNLMQSPKVKRAGLQGGAAPSPILEESEWGNGESAQHTPTTTSQGAVQGVVGRAFDPRIDEVLEGDFNGNGHRAPPPAPRAVPSHQVAPVKTAVLASSLAAWAAEDEETDNVPSQLIGASGSAAPTSALPFSPPSSHRGASPQSAGTPVAGPVSVSRPPLAPSRTIIAAGSAGAGARSPAAPPFPVLPGPAPGPQPNATALLAAFAREDEDAAGNEQAWLREGMKGTGGRHRLQGRTSLAPTPASESSGIPMGWLVAGSRSDGGGPADESSVLDRSESFLESPDSRRHPRGEDVPLSLMQLDAGELRSRLSSRLSSTCGTTAINQYFPALAGAAALRDLATPTGTPDKAHRGWRPGAEGSTSAHRNDQPGPAFRSMSMASAWTEPDSSTAFALGAHGSTTGGTDEEGDAFDAFEPADFVRDHVAEERRNREKLVLLLTSQLQSKTIAANTSAVRPTSQQIIRMWKADPSLRIWCVAQHALGPILDALGAHGDKPIIAAWLLRLLNALAGDSGLQHGQGSGASPRNNTTSVSPEQVTSIGFATASQPSVGSNARIRSSTSVTLTPQDRTLREALALLGSLAIVLPFASPDRATPVRTQAAAFALRMLAGGPLPAKVFVAAGGLPALVHLLYPSPRPAIGPSALGAQGGSAEASNIRRSSAGRSGTDIAVDAVTAPQEGQAQVAGTSGGGAKASQPTTGVGAGDQTENVAQLDALSAHWEQAEATLLRAGIVGIREVLAMASTTSIPHHSLVEGLPVSSASTVTTNELRRLLLRAGVGPALTHALRRLFLHVCSQAVQAMQVDSSDGAHSRAGIETVRALSRAQFDESVRTVSPIAPGPGGMPQSSAQTMPKERTRLHHHSLSLSTVGSGEAEGADVRLAVPGSSGTSGSSGLHGLAGLRGRTVSLEDSKGAVEGGGGGAGSGGSSSAVSSSSGDDKEWHSGFRALSSTAVPTPTLPSPVGRLPHPLPRPVAASCASLARVCDLVLTFAQGDGPVKAAFGTKEVCSSLLRLLRPAPFALLGDEHYATAVVRALRAVRWLSLEPVVAEPLAEADGVQLLVGFLAREVAASLDGRAAGGSKAMMRDGVPRDNTTTAFNTGEGAQHVTWTLSSVAPEVCSSVVGGLFNLLRVNRARQNAAAAAGLVLPLMTLSGFSPCSPRGPGKGPMDGRGPADTNDWSRSPLQPLALTMLADMAHAGPAARHALWQARADIAFVRMLGMGYWCAPGLSALASWASGASAGRGAEAGVGAAVGAAKGEPYARELASVLAQSAPLTALVSVFVSAQGPLLEVLLPPFVAVVERCRPVAQALGGISDLVQPQIQGAGEASPSSRFMPVLVMRTSEAKRAVSLKHYLALLRAIFDAQGAAAGVGPGQGHGLQWKPDSAWVGSLPPTPTGHSHALSLAPPAGSSSMAQGQAHGSTSSLGSGSREAVVAVGKRKGTTTLASTGMARTTSFRSLQTSPGEVNQATAANVLSSGAARKAAFVLLWDVGNVAARVAVSHADKVVVASTADALARDCASALVDRDVSLSAVAAAVRKGTAVAAVEAHRS